MKTPVHHIVFLSLLAAAVCEGAWRSRGSIEEGLAPDISALPSFPPRAHPFADRTQLQLEKDRDPFGFDTNVYKHSLKQIMSKSQGRRNIAIADLSSSQLRGSKRFMRQSSPDSSTSSLYTAEYNVQPVDGIIFPQSHSAFVDATCSPQSVSVQVSELGAAVPWVPGSRLVLLDGCTCVDGPGTDDPTPHVYLVIRRRISGDTVRGRTRRRLSEPGTIVFDVAAMSPADLIANGTMKISRHSEPVDPTSLPVMSSTTRPFFTMPFAKRASISRSLDVFNFNYDSATNRASRVIPIFSETLTQPGLVVHAQADCVNCYAYQRFDFTIGIDFNWLTPTLFYINVGSSTEAHAEIAVNVTADLSKSWEYPIFPEISLPTISFWIGPLPVTVESSASATLQLTLDASARATFTTGFHFSTTAELYASVSTSSPSENYFRRSPIMFQVTPPELRLEVDANAVAKLSAKLRISLWDVAPVDFWIIPRLHADFEYGTPTADQSCAAGSGLFTSSYSLDWMFQVSPLAFPAWIPYLGGKYQSFGGVLPYPSELAERSIIPKTPLTCALCSGCIPFSIPGQASVSKPKDPDFAQVSAPIAAGLSGQIVIQRAQLTWTCTRFSTVRVFRCPWTAQGIAPTNCSSLGESQRLSTCAPTFNAAFIAFDFNIRGTLFFLQVWDTTIAESLIWTGVVDPAECGTSFNCGFSAPILDVRRENGTLFVATNNFPTQQQFLSRLTQGQTTPEITLPGLTCHFYETLSVAPVLAAPGVSVSYSVQFSSGAPLRGGMSLDSQFRFPRPGIDSLAPFTVSTATSAYFSVCNPQMATVNYRGRHFAFATANFFTEITSTHISNSTYFVSVFNDVREVGAPVNPGSYAMALVRAVGNMATQSLVSNSTAFISSAVIPPGGQNVQIETEFPFLPTSVSLYNYFSVIDDGSFKAMAGKFFDAAWSQPSITALTRVKLALGDDPSTINFVSIRFMKQQSGLAITGCIWSNQIMPGPVAPANRRCATDNTGAIMLRMNFVPTAEFLSNFESYFMLHTPGRTNLNSVLTVPIRTILSSSPSPLVSISPALQRVVFEFDPLLWPQTDRIRANVELFTDPAGVEKCALSSCFAALCFTAASEYSSTRLENSVDTCANLYDFEYDIATIASSLGITVANLKSQKFFLVLERSYGDQVFYARLRAWAMAEIAPGQTLPTQKLDSRRWMHYHIKTTTVNANRASGFRLDVAPSASGAEIQLLGRRNELPTYDADGHLSIRRSNGSSSMASGHYPSTETQSFYFSAATDSDVVVEYSVAAATLPASQVRLSVYESSPSSSISPSIVRSVGFNLSLSTSDKSHHWSDDITSYPFDLVETLISQSLSGISMLAGGWNAAVRPVLLAKLNDLRVFNQTTRPTDFVFRDIENPQILVISIPPIPSYTATADTLTFQPTPLLLDSLDTRGSIASFYISDAPPVPPVAVPQAAPVSPAIPAVSPSSPGMPVSAPIPPSPSSGATAPQTTSAPTIIIADAPLALSAPFASAAPQDLSSPMSDNTAPQTTSTPVSSIAAPQTTSTPRPVQNGVAPQATSGPVSQNSGPNQSPMANVPSSLPPRSVPGSPIQVAAVAPTATTVVSSTAQAYINIPISLVILICVLSFM